MRILVDMNLSPDWVAVLAKHGLAAVHWSAVGDPGAEDAALMDWARANDHIVFTHDLDFGAMLALTNAEAPSHPGPHTGRNAGPSGKGRGSHFANYAALLADGALIVLDEGRSRVRILPLGRR
jgi:hypothetical protein